MFFFKEGKVMTHIPDGVVRRVNWLAFERGLSIGAESTLEKNVTEQLN